MIPRFSKYRQLRILLDVICLFGRCVKHILAFCKRSVFWGVCFCGVCIFGIYLDIFGFRTNNYKVRPSVCLSLIRRYHGRHLKKNRWIGENTPLNSHVECQWQHIDVVARLFYHTTNDMRKYAKPLYLFIYGTEFHSQSNS